MCVSGQGLYDLETTVSLSLSAFANHGSKQLYFRMARRTAQEKMTGWAKDFTDEREAEVHANKEPPKLKVIVM